MAFSRLKGVLTGIPTPVMTDYQGTARKLMGSVDELPFGGSPSLSTLQKLKALEGFQPFSGNYCPALTWYRLGQLVSETTLTVKR